MDKNDLVSFFQELRILYGSSVGSTTLAGGPGSGSVSQKANKNMEWMNKIEEYLAKDNVDLLDIKRMYRFLDKNVKKEDIIEDVEDNDDDDDFEVD
jgi:hypothetical protein